EQQPLAAPLSVHLASGISRPGWACSRAASPDGRSRFDHGRPGAADKPRAALPAPAPLVRTAGDRAAPRQSVGCGRAGDRSTRGAPDRFARACAGKPATYSHARPLAAGSRVMVQADSPSISFVDALWPAPGVPRVARGVLLALAGSALLTLSAKFQVPFYPVPMTMQPLVVLLIGLAFGASLGAATVLLYLAEGVIGLPVFAGPPEKGIGLTSMLGATGGYLVGFALAAAIVGWIAERRRDALGL